MKWRDAERRSRFGDKEEVIRELRVGTEQLLNWDFGLQVISH